MGNRILLISGSLRRGSTSSAVLATVLAYAPANVEAVRYDGMARLPHFNPDDDVEPLDPAVADLRAQINQAGAILFCTPEYAGALPGSLKNLLDWTVGDGESSGKRVGWINASAAPGGAVAAYNELRRVVNYTDWTVVEPAAAAIPVPRAAVGDGGLVVDPAAREQIMAVVATLADSMRS